MSSKIARVFVVEDDPFLRLDLEDTLGDLGCQIAASVGTLDEALALAAAVECDVAILDLNLGNSRVDAVADRLAARGIPLLFATGYGESDRPENHPAAAILQKPYRPDVLSAVLAKIM